MGKVIKFKNKNTNDMEEFLDNVKKQVLEENIDNMILVCKAKDGTILTGYTRNLDWR